MPTASLTLTPVLLKTGRNAGLVGSASVFVSAVVPTTTLLRLQVTMDETDRTDSNLIGLTLTIERLIGSAWRTVASTVWNGADVRDKQGNAVFPRIDVFASALQGQEVRATLNLPRAMSAGVSASIP